MEYLLLFHSPAPELELEPDDPSAAAHWQSWRAYLGALHAAGVARSGNALQPPYTATTIRVRGEQRQIHDGPFADTKEMLGGYLVIEVPSLDEAIRWAERSPSSLRGSTEVRPIRALESR